MKIGSKKLNRWQAAAVHLTISFVIACVAMLFIRFVFYPNFYFHLSGGLKLFFLIVGVDVVVGPLLTLTIYKAGKKGLKFDLCVIVLLQITALAYGAHIMWLARPVYTVFVVDRFVVVSASEVDQESLEKAKPEYHKSPLFGPILAATERPSTREERNKILFSSLFSGTDIQNYPEYYVPFGSKKGDVIQKSMPLSKLREVVPEAERELKKFLKKYGGKDDDYRYLPIKGVGFTFMTMILDGEGAPITALPVDSEPEA